MQQVTVDGVKNYLGNLRAGGIIEEGETRFLIERRKKRTDSSGGEGDNSGCEYLLIDLLGSWCLMIYDQCRMLADPVILVSQ